MIGRTRDPNKAEVGDVRATNLAVVLRCVREQGPCSRADIAAATGLNKTTVSSLVSELLRRRLLRETGTTENRVGRPAIMLALDGASSAAIGIEVNADYLTAVAVGYLGLFLVTAAFAAIGCFASTLTDKQALAAAGGFFGASLLWLAEWPARNTSGLAKTLLTGISLRAHLLDFFNGVLVASHVVFYLSLAALWLLLAVKAVESMRWR